MKQHQDHTIGLHQSLYKFAANTHRKYSLSVQCYEGARLT